LAIRYAVVGIKLPGNFETADMDHSQWQEN